jgi:hypothetical protein
MEAAATSSSPAATTRPTHRALYVSGNEGKHAEAQHIVRLLCGGDLELERVSVELPEVQGTPEQIATAK